MWQSQNACIFASQLATVQNKNKKSLVNIFVDLILSGVFLEDNETLTTYLPAGSYDIDVIIVDSDGGISCDTSTISVNVNPYTSSNYNQLISRSTTLYSNLNIDAANNDNDIDTVMNDILMVAYIVAVSFDDLIYDSSYDSAIASQFELYRTLMDSYDDGLSVAR